MQKTHKIIIAGVVVIAILIVAVVAVIMLSQPKTTPPNPSPSVTASSPTKTPTVSSIPTSTPIAITPTGTSQIKILTRHGYTTSIGSCNIEGELQNTGTGAAEFVKVTATFFDAQNVTIATDFSYSTLDTINPNQKSPFLIILNDKDQAARVEYYSLAATFQTTTSLVPALKILPGSSTRVDSLGEMHVTGEVQNDGTATAKYVKVVATFYDQNGTVVGGDYSYVNSTDIPPGQKDSFEIVYVWDEAGITRIASYILTAESLEYTVLP